MPTHQRFFATAPRGLEGLLPAGELRAPGLDNAREQRGGVVNEYGPVPL